jgi:hypothetical protein
MRTLTIGFPPHFIEKPLHEDNAKPSENRKLLLDSRISSSSLCQKSPLQTSPKQLLTPIQTNFQSCPNQLLYVFNQRPKVPKAAFQSLFTLASKPFQNLKICPLQVL